MRRYWRAFRGLAGPILAGVVLSGCGSEPLGPVDELSVSFATEHFLYHMAPGDTVEGAWQESYFSWLTGELGLTASGLIHYNKYRNRAHLERLTGRATNGFAEPEALAFHTIWPRDNHEVVHTLVISEVGIAPALLNEGIAVAHQGDARDGQFVPDEPHWNGEPVHSIARRRLVTGQLPELDELLKSTDFFDYTNEQVYPIAGSFVRYLIDQEGIAAFKAYLSTSTFDDSREATRAKFLQAFGDSLDTWWNRWLEFLSAS